MPKTLKKFIRCPHLNKNLWILLDVEKDKETGKELLIGMTCKARDLLERKGTECNTPCNNYFFSEEET